MGLLGDLEIVVVEADRAEGERHAEHDPDIVVGGIGPQHRRHHDPEQDHQAAHGGRALLGDEVRLRPVGADRLALALLQAQVVDDPRPEQKHEHAGRDHRAAGAQREVAEHVEDGDLVGKCGKPIEHGSALSSLEHDQPWRERCRCRRVATRKLALQRLDDRSHPRAERALDHDGVARTDGGEHMRLPARPRSPHSRPGARREEPPTAHASAARSRRPGRCRARASARRARDADRRPRRRVPACRRAPRCAGRAARSRPGRAARAPPASRPDWRCSSRRSAAPLAAAERARCATPRPVAGLSSASASAASARSAPASETAASTASELSTRCLPGRAELVGDVGAENARLHGRAIGLQRELDQPRIGLGVLAERHDARDAGAAGARRPGARIADCRD